MEIPITRSIASNPDERIGSQKLPFIEFLSICLFGIFYIEFQIQSQYQLISPFIALVYIGYCMVKDTSIRKPLFQFLGCCSVLSLMWQFLTIPVTIKGEDVGMKYLYSNFSQYLLTFFPVLLFYRVSTYASEKQIRIILGIILVFAIVLIQAALKFAEINPDILHSMNQDVLKEAGVTLQGFNFVYAFTFLIITGIVLFQHYYSKLLKWISLAGIIYFIYFLLTAQFALAFVTTFISCLYLYYTTAKNKDKRCFIILGLVVLYFVIPYLLEILINLTKDSAVLNVRLTEIYESLTGNHSGNSDLQARLDLYEKCIVAFFRSPIWGNPYLDFNGHATFLLAFAYLGIFGGFLVCWMFYKAAVYIHSILGDEKYIYFRPLMLQIILMGLTNPITSVPSNFIMLFFVCPLVIKRYIR
ncbi:MAG: hypothetical protein NC453_31050 [Muribaculum sp.]|nr:hypothetical protein [Muribaculum sp.]